MPVQVCRSKQVVADVCLDGRQWSSPACSKSAGVSADAVESGRTVLVSHLMPEGLKHQR